MAHRTSHTPSGASDGTFDLSQIFIGRQQQLDLFEIYLNRWKQLILDAGEAETLMTAAPSPNNKIQGLVVLLYGRGGFGKSTLLRRYREQALQANSNPLTGKLTISEVADWEFAVEGKRSLFNPPHGHEVDPADYYKVMCGELIRVLQRKADDFEHYQRAVRAVEEARKQANRVLDTMQKDERFGSLRWLAGEGMLKLVRWAAPLVGLGAVSKVLDNEQVAEKVKEVVGTGVEIGADHLMRLYTRLQDELGSRLGDYLDPALRLGLALGRDLREFARNYPLLIFFDTYEEIDEGDRYLRIMMGAAGTRVAWVVAGRDNLWAGTGQIERTVGLEYGYKELVPSDRGLPVDFNVGGVGAFTISDIQDYFDLLCQKVQFEPPLAAITPDSAKRILDVTRGVPLAVKIAAALYLDTADLEIITEHVEGKREIVDQMVRRYLLHARDNQDDRMKLYGLAMLRRADQPIAVAAALGLTPEQARTSYTIELSRLHRRYSFIFTEKEEPTLHQEVRLFLRLWLLEHCQQPDIKAVNERLMETHQSDLKTLEERRKYGTVKARFEDEQWVGIYLDLVEQQMWLDPSEGVRYALPFMIGASIYNDSALREAITTGSFFQEKMRSPELEWWKWARKGLSGSSQDLKALLRVIAEQRIDFPDPLPDYRDVVEALLWWKLAESYRSNDKNQALEWYEKALTPLAQETKLCEAAATTYWYVSDPLVEEKKYAESLPYLNRAIELNPDYVNAYNDRGGVYFNLKQYEQALGDCNHALELDPNYVHAYNWRGNVYKSLRRYKQALADYNRTLELNPKYVHAYNNRGNLYSNLKQYEQALADYNRALELDPHYVHAYNGRGNIYKSLRQYEQALVDYNHALELDPALLYPYYNRGHLYLLLKDKEQALNNFRKCWSLKPPTIDAALMAIWVKMSRESPGLETAIQLEEAALVDSKDYGAYVCRGIALGVRGRIKEGLAELEKAIDLEPEEPEAYLAYFWKGMLSAYYYRDRYQVAIEAIEKSLVIGDRLPPVLLTPLYWLEKDRPDFFERYARPLLKKYGV